MTSAELWDFVSAVALATIGGLVTGIIGRTLWLYLTKRK